MKSTEIDETDIKNVDGLLSSEQIEEFHRRGVLVVRNFLNGDEVAEARKGFHDYLRSQGIDPNNLEVTADKLSPLSSTGGSGGVIDAFYQEWKLSLNENPKAVSIMSELWETTFAKCEKPYDHPFGKFNSKEALMYIDRVCYRVPDRISELHCSDKVKKRPLQRSLTPHIDCCPHKMFQDIGEFKYSKWRPIQAFIALTDTTGRNTGGFEACPGHHLEFEAWTQNRTPNPVKQIKNIIIQKSRLQSQLKKCSVAATAHDTVTAVALDAVPQSVSDSDSLVDSAVKPLESVGIGAGTGIGTGSKIGTGSEPPCVGQFTPIRMIEDADIISRFEHIPCMAGDLVLWDYRIPHSNSYRNTSEITREAVYIGILPNIPLNREYIADQLTRFRAGIVPIDQWHSHNDPQLCNYPFSELGRKMVGIDLWETAS